MTERGLGDSPEGDPGAGMGPPQDIRREAGVRPAQSFDFLSMLQIADSLPVMVAFADSGQIYRFCNQSIADWFERPRRDILGRSVAEIMGENAYALRREAIEAALQGERQFFAADFNHPTRGHLTTQSEYVPQRAPDGSITGVTMIVQDITEQRAAERAIKESEARFRRIANSAPALMWVSRRDGSRDFANQAYLDFFNVDARESRTHDWTTVIHPDDRDAALALYREHRDLGIAIEFEARFRDAEERYRWLRVTTRPRLNDDGELIGYNGVATDITVAKEAELQLRRQVRERTAALESAQDQLRQSQKMEALGQLTGGIAHDFNNLLTVVVGGLDMILKRTDDDKIERYARNALVSAERGARLTAQLLAFSRVQRLEVKPTRISDLVDEIRPILRNVLGPGIDKDFDLDDGCGKVMADPTQVEVAVLNLVINARDAMPDGGRLSITTRDIAVASDDGDLDPGDYVELAIADTGEGMPPDIVARAFEPFFTTKEVGKGTGLGLSMVYGMTRQSGGGARIVSEPGVGTTVFLYFRRVADEEDVGDSKPSSPKVADTESHALTVLVIDDDPDVRAFLVNNLNEQGYEVEEAADGASGIEAFRRKRPDIVVLDYLMPGMTGAQVATELRAEVPAQKILFVSGYSETEAIERAAPGATLLAKPFKPEALDSAIRQLAAD